MTLPDEQFYTNKELFEMFELFKAEVKEVQAEMRETKILIRDYNGLRALITDHTQRLIQIEACTETKEKSNTNWSGTIFGTLGILVALAALIVPILR